MIEYHNNTGISDWIVAPLAIGATLLILSWFTVLPTIGLLWIFGVLK